MKKFKARKEREQQEAIVRPRLEIVDPSAELFSQPQSWRQEDRRRNSFLDQSLEQKSRNMRNVPRLKIGNSADSCYTPLAETGPLFDLSSLSYEPHPDMMASSCPTESYMWDDPPPPLPERHIDHTAHASARKRAYSSPPTQLLEPLSMSPSKTNFQLFSQRCAPSPTSTSPSPTATTPLFNLSAEEAMFSIANASPPVSPIELEGSPVETTSMEPAPLQSNKYNSEPEPEASPYNRFTTFTKSIHALSANLSPIEETEEEAASRRSSIIQAHELSAITSITPPWIAAYANGTTVTPRLNRSIGIAPGPATAPSRNTSTRSSDSTDSTSLHSVFSFEFSHSDTERMYVSQPTNRRASSAPSLSDASSLDDLDLDSELDLEKRQDLPRPRRDTKLERFFGIRQYSVSSDSDSNTASDPLRSPSSPTNMMQNTCREAPYGHKQQRSSISVNDLDLSLALESDPYKREMISMHKSLLAKSQNKQDAKLEKFFGCDKDQIQVARQFSTGSRLAGCTDDLKYRSIGW